MHDLTLPDCDLTQPLQRSFQPFLEVLWFEPCKRVRTLVLASIVVICWLMHYMPRLTAWTVQVGCGWDVHQYLLSKRVTVHGEDACFLSMRHHTACISAVLADARPRQAGLPPHPSLGHAAVINHGM